MNEEGQIIAPLFGGATIAVTSGCLLVPTVTRAADGFLSTLVRYEAIAAPVAAVAVLLLVAGLRMSGAAVHRLPRIAVLEVALFAVVGGIVGLFGGGPALGILVFGLPAAVVLLGAVAGLRFFRTHPRSCAGVVSVGTLLALAGLIVIVAA